MSWQFNKMVNKTIIEKNIKKIVLSNIPSQDIPFWDRSIPRPEASVVVG
jgi:hypothetical protein